MWRILFFSLFLVSIGFQSFAQEGSEQNLGYCEGHPRKIISVPASLLFTTVQDELNNISSQENWHNNRYELCLDIQTSDGFLHLELDQKLRLNYTGEIIAVVGFLSVRGSEDSTDCLFLENVSNISIVASEFANCQRGIHVKDSQDVFIGPERFDEFAVKKNKIHRNNRGIYVENSQRVFVRHNKIFMNLGDNYADPIYSRGLQLVDSNTMLLNGNDQVLPTPIVDLIGPGTPRIGNVIRFDENGNAFIDMKVAVPTGTIEFFHPFSNTPPAGRYQPWELFSDCSFNNLAMDQQGYGLIRCSIQVSNRIRGGGLSAILHGNGIGSSHFVSVLLVSPEDPTGMPLSGPAPTTGSMTGEVSNSPAGETGSVPVEAGKGDPPVVPGTPESPVSASGVGTGEKSLCAFLPNRRVERFEGFMWGTLIILFFTSLRIIRRKTRACTNLSDRENSPHTVQRLNRDKHV